jgi:hypothetical protein
MLHTSTKKLIDRLADMTRRQRLSWEQGEDGRLFHDTEGYRVIITPQPHVLLVTDALGKAIESTTPADYADASDGKGRPYADVIQELFSEADRNARGAEKAIDQVLKFLDKRDTEFEPVKPATPVVATAEPLVNLQPPEMLTDETRNLADIVIPRTEESSVESMTAAVATLAEKVNLLPAEPVPPPAPIAPPLAEPVLAEPPASIAPPLAEPVLAEPPAPIAPPLAEPVLAEPPAPTAPPVAEPVLAEPPAPAATPIAAPLMKKPVAPVPFFTAQTFATQAVSDDFLPGAEFPSAFEGPEASPSWAAPTAPQAALADEWEVRTAPAPAPVAEPAQTTVSAPLAEASVDENAVSDPEGFATSNETPLLARTEPAPVTALVPQVSTLEPPAPEPPVPVEPARPALTGFGSGGFFGSRTMSFGGSGTIPPAPAPAEPARQAAAAPNPVEEHAPQSVMPVAAPNPAAPAAPHLPVNANPQRISLSGLGVAGADAATAIPAAPPEPVVSAAPPPPIPPELLETRPPQPVEAQPVEAAEAQPDSGRQPSRPAPKFNPWN